MLGRALFRADLFPYTRVQSWNNPPECNCGYVELVVKSQIKRIKAVRRSSTFPAKWIFLVIILIDLIGLYLTAHAKKKKLLSWFAFNEETKL